MEDFEKRVYKERDDLNERFRKLTSFLNTDKFFLLPDDERDRLYIQRRYMRQYLEVLIDRINNNFE